MMTVQEFNNTAEGKRLNEKVAELHQQIEMVLHDVRRKTEETDFGAYIEWDDSGFFENNHIR